MLDLKKVTIPLLMPDPEDIRITAARLLTNIAGLGFSLWYAFTRHFLANNGMGLAYSIEVCSPSLRPRHTTCLSVEMPCFGASIRRQPCVAKCDQNPAPVSIGILYLYDYARAVRRCVSWGNCSTPSPAPHGCSEPMQSGRCSPCTCTAHCQHIDAHLHGGNGCCRELLCSIWGRLKSG